jgi:hypothetical protein
MTGWRLIRVGANSDEYAPLLAIPLANGLRNGLP